MQKARFYIEKFDIVTSTNDILKVKAKQGAPEGTVIVADAQTAGRGRMGRQFESPVGSGIYMSVLLRPASQIDDALTITARAAVSVAKAIEKHSGRSAGIKWVNDIYQNGKKVCGILAEGAVDVSSGGLDYVVLGIGINLKEPEGGFPEHLRDIAGAVFIHEEIFDRDEIVWDILNELFSNSTDCYDEYVKRNILSGKTVTVYRNGQPMYSAKVLGIDHSFGLEVQLDNGSRELLRSGEVSVRA